MNPADRVGTWAGRLPALVLGLTTLAGLGGVRASAQELAAPIDEPASLESGRAPLPLPPSTVSPTIERFVRDQGSKLPTPPRPTVDRPAEPGPRRGPAERNPTVPGPLGGDIRLKPAPTESTDRRFSISLATALRLSDARPLIVAAAQAGVWISEAELTRAKVLWVPALTFAADYIRHDGGGPDFNKGILTAPSVNYFYAGPSLFQYVNLTDAIFEPLAARQALNARQWDVQSAKNDALRQTADAYFAVHQRRGIYAGTLYVVGLGRKLVADVEALSRDLVPADEIDRARNVLADIEQSAVSARQDWRVESANLTQILRLDPRAVVEPLERDHAQITLIDPGLGLDALLPIALANRPELGSRKALVEAAEYRVRREKSRPLLPLVMLNGFQTSGGMTIQGGIFGIGPNNSLNQWAGRDDVSIQLMWQLEGFGFGNLARIKAQRGRESRAIIDLRQAQDDVAAEVNQAQARVQSAAARVLQADRALREGIITFRGHLEGLGQTQRFGDVLTLVFRPQEAVYSLVLLNRALDEYFTTVAEYNRAQFSLFHALGYPARELTIRRPAGETSPTDLARPAYLPPVGHGPPPASR